MTTQIALQIIAILLLILANGAFAMAEIAVLSANKNRLRQMAEDGNRGAQVALDLLDTPNRFLSAVQVGITLIGILNGALGGATIGNALGGALAQIPALEPYAMTLGVGIVVVLITYLTLLFGELAPKRLALSNPTATAAAIARPMNFLAHITAPIVQFLSLSTSAVVSLFGVDQSREADVTVEDVEMMIEHGANLGVFESFEADIAERLFDLNDIRLSLLMTPRTDIVWLNLDDPLEVNWEKMARGGHSYYLVGDGSLDRPVGFVAVKDIWADRMAGGEGRLQTHLRQPLFLPENMTALDGMERLKTRGEKRAVVINEHGGLEGLVTVDDMLEAIVGEILEPDEMPGPEVVERDDRTWLIDARLPAERLKELFGLASLPGEKESSYETVGGFVMMMLGEIPEEADQFELDGLCFEVVDMDGYRVDKVLVRRVDDANPAGDEPSPAEPTGG